MIHITNPPDGLHDAVDRIKDEWILSRIWAHDHTVWKPSPEEISNRLGWLHAPFTMMREVDRITAFANDVRADGIERVVLLGMGGSSLAPEALAKVFGAAPGYPELTVLDSTHPDAIRSVEDTLDIGRTLFLVATKSGTTVETLSLFRYFYHRVREVTSMPGSQFVAITDPGSPLVALGDSCRFRRTFLNDPNIGGRYSALSLFGLIPAALLGIDIAELLKRAQRASIVCAKYHDLAENPAVQLAALLGACAAAGRDKLTIFTSPALAGLADWIEQLVAESTGKEGTGILPIVRGALPVPGSYGDDRLFVSIKIAGEPLHEKEAATHKTLGWPKAISELVDNRLNREAAVTPQKLGFPEATLEIADRKAIAEQFFIWELATAIVGNLFGINPFDQPNVESAKSRAREMIDAYRKTGALPSGSDVRPFSLDALAAVLADAGLRMGDYVAFHAYLPPDESAARLDNASRQRCWGLARAACTFGYGPRFLHSTGQLHKGDRGNGHFVQLLRPPSEDLPIPNTCDDPSSSLTFGTLIAAQALGDRQALLDAGRAVWTFELGPDAETCLRKMEEKWSIKGEWPWPGRI
jgi:glucose-6-phosphate isomerase